VADAPTDADALQDIARLPGVAAAVDEARAAVDALRGHRVLRRSAEQVSAEAALRGGRASAALDGADLPLSAVRRTIAAAGQLPEAEGPVLEGALRVAAELGLVRATWRQAPLQVLARLHSLAAAGLAGADALGRPRPAVAGRVAALAALLAAPTDAPAIVVAAVVHGELAGPPAFEVAAGVVARAASRLVLVTRGLDPASVSVPEVGLVELGRERYDAALAGYGSGTADGVADWVRHCASSVVLGAREGVAICEGIQRG
jgi:hypothetical protein